MPTISMHTPASVSWMWKIDLVGGIATPVAQGVGEQLGEHQGDVAESPGVSGVGRC